jgi:DNA-binding MarR family transcriptional regulator
MASPSRTALERWFGAERAGEVQFAEAVASWPSLRVLDHLYASEPATTGDIARALNMDMRDVKDRLDALESHGTVEETADGWETTTNRISITLTQNNGLKIAHALGTEEKRDREQADQQSDEETDESMVTSLRRFVSSLFP